MLQEKNALPDAELDAPVGNRDRQLGLGQGTLDVRRHVVGPFVVVAIEGDILRYEPPQKCLEIAQHLRRRVLLDQQRSRGVRDVDGKEAERDGLALDPAGDLGRDLLDLARCSVDRQSGLGDGHGWLLPTPRYRRLPGLPRCPSAVAGTGLSSPHRMGKPDEIYFLRRDASGSSGLQRRRARSEYRSLARSRRRRLAQYR